MRTFLIYTAEQTVRIEARSLARAVAMSGIDEKVQPILAAVEEKCVPQTASADVPFLLAVVRNQNHRPPEDDY